MKRKEIRKKYYDYILSRKKGPGKLNDFLSYAEIKKKSFKAKYNSLDDVEADIWIKGLKGSLNSLKESAEFAAYSSRDRGLATVYTWFEYMDLNRKFFKRSRFTSCPYLMQKCCMNDFKKMMKKHMKSVIKQGFSSCEFKDRSIPMKYMADFFWGIFIMNLKSWKKVKKGKKNREEWMDAMVEKSMVFFFDSLAPNLFDAFFDLLKHQRSGK